MEEYQNWKYDCRSDGKCFKFEVVPSEKMMEPASFFKYYALNSYSIEALTGCYVYATHPNKFNDSIDCNSQILNFQNASKKDLEALYGPYYNKFLEIYETEQNLKNYISEHFKLIAYKHIGIICLATNNDSIYHWSNYSQNASGFCVEFDVEMFPFRYFGPFPMHYVDKITPVDVRNNIPTALLIQTNIKTKDWKNEQEWRLLVSNPNGLDFDCYNEDESYKTLFNSVDDHKRKMKYPLNAIKSITLGERFFKSPDIRRYTITENEEEVVFLNKKTVMQRQILDFLENKLFVVYEIYNVLGVLKLQEIKIVKLHRQIYRIIKI